MRVLSAVGILLLIGFIGDVASQQRNDVTPQTKKAVKAAAVNKVRTYQFPRRSNNERTTVWRIRQ